MRNLKKFIVLVLFAGHGIALEIVGSVPAPGPEVRGVAFDGQYIWCSDAYLDTIYRIDPRNGEVVHRLAYDIPGGYGGIEWDPAGYLWVAERRYIYRVDPWTGAKLGRIWAPGC